MIRSTLFVIALTVGVLSGRTPLAAPDPWSCRLKFDSKPWAEGFEYFGCSHGGWAIASRQDADVKVGGRKCIIVAPGGKFVFGSNHARNHHIVGFVDLPEPEYILTSDQRAIVEFAVDGTLMAKGVWDVGVSPTPPLRYTAWLRFGEEETTRWIRKGREISVRIEKREWRISLKGSSEALGGLASCLRR